MESTSSQPLKAEPIMLRPIMLEVTPIVLRIASAFPPGPDPAPPEPGSPRAVIRFPFRYRSALQ